MVGGAAAAAAAASGLLACDLFRSDLLCHRSNVAATAEDARDTRANNNMVKTSAGLAWWLHADLFFT